MRVFMPDSYPPASLFDPEIGAAELIESIRASNDEPIPRPLALVLPLPSARQPEFARDVERLRREVDLVARLFDRDRDVIELHVDAGEADAPWRLACFSDLIDALRHQFHFSSAAAGEMTIHTDPGVLRPGEIAILAAAGFNRIAFTAARVDPLLVRACRDGGFRSIAVTVSEGRTFDTPGAIETELESVLALWPERLIVGGCTDAARTCGAERIRANLELAGYTCIGPRLYALPHDDLSAALRAGHLRYGPVGYTPHTECDWLGFGPGAVSRVGDCHVRNAGNTAQWRRDVDGGRLPARSGRLLTAGDRVRAEVIQQLLCRGMIAIREVEENHGIQFRRWFAAELARLRSCFAAGFARDLGDRIVVGSPGWPWLRKMAACFESCDIGALLEESAQAR